MQAVKIIQFDKVRKKFFIKDEQLIKMINTEMRLLKKLSDSPHIVRHHSSIFSSEKEKIFIVLEHCSKGSLLKISQDEGSFNRKNKDKVERWFNTVLMYFRQLVNGISFSKNMSNSVHEKNIIHRDIKPENVLVTTDCVVKIIDFNISE